MQNDPVNFIDPLGLCTFNISLLGTGGLLDIQIDAVKRTLTEIYTAAGLELVFNQPKKASGPDLS